MLVSPIPEAESGVKRRGSPPGYPHTLKVTCVTGADCPYLASPWKLTMGERGLIRNLTIFLFTPTRRHFNEGSEEGLDTILYCFQSCVVI